jgi:hypothetical protein
MIDIHFKLFFDLKLHGRKTGQGLGLSGDHGKFKIKK